ncbi:Fic family protein [Pseudactinotalea sp. Z1748]|uniref:Fic family protein n=1 Tax=Pseudactinotalea sp. Z1748 TaxID=3413027 RepID=UPI003C7C01D3
MVNRPGKWAVGSNQYLKRPRPGRDEPQDVHLSAPVDPVERHAQRDALGITFDHFDVDGIKPSGTDRARARFRARLPDLVWNAAALEGNTFTLPDVRTLLEGGTVGGRTRFEQDQVLALSEAYNELDEMVADGTFIMSKDTSDRLHGLLARHEAIESGHFRGEGDVTGGGSVRLASGGTVEGIEHGAGGADLMARYEGMVEYLNTVADPRKRALIYFASATRAQFYFDGNKRTARLMASGILMSSGYDTVNVPVARKLEFNLALDELFSTDEATMLLRFLADCTD